MAAAELTDMNDLIIDTENNTVFLKKPGMKLDVGAVAKAYAEKLALKAARDAGLNSAIISAGGNVTTIGKPADTRRESWNVGVQDPSLTENTLDVVNFSDKTMAVSGGYQRYYIVNGQTYHHIIDLETLMPASRYRQVCIIHEDPATADLLSTALFILPYEQGRALAEGMNADALWVDVNGEWFYTDGYAAVSKQAAK